MSECAWVHVPLGTFTRLPINNRYPPRVRYTNSLVEGGSSVPESVFTVVLQASRAECKMGSEGVGDCP